MHLQKHEIPVRIDLPGAVARQLPDFGIAEGALGVEYFSLATGADLAPLLEGLTDNACQAEHWGYLVSGDVLVTYSDGSSEKVTGGDVFYWPAGHSVRVELDAELVMFSPQVEHGRVMDHILAKVAATT
jgi:mannose-6-phosphate isomerase-like protein (cupin superfamily)